jgi:hypothetical protein
MTYDPSQQWTTPVGPVKYHCQDTLDTYCGPASIMMVLQYAQTLAGNVPNLVDQATSYTWIQANCPYPPWKTSPTALPAALTYFDTSGLGAGFTLATPCDHLAAAQQVIASLSDPGGLPPTVLWNGIDHWVVIAAAILSAEPVPGGSAYVLGFCINKPVEEPSGERVPPHTSTDACGTGNGWGQQGQVCGWRTWCDNVYPVTQPPLQGTCAVALGGPAATIGTIVEPPDELWTERVAVREFELLAPSVVAKIAVRFAVATGVFDDPHGVTPSRPVLVEDLDADWRARYYSIVLLTGRDDARAAVTVDASNGDPLWLTCDAAVRPFATSDEVAAALAGTELDRHFDLGPRLVPGGFSVSPVLAWRRSRESVTPFQPFHQITVGGRVLFRDVHGKLHRRLTPLPQRFGG